MDGNILRRTITMGAPQQGGNRGQIKITTIQNRAIGHEACDGQFKGRRVNQSISPLMALSPA